MLRYAGRNAAKNMARGFNQDTPFIVASKETFYEMLLDSEMVHRHGDRGFIYEVGRTVCQATQNDTLLFKVR